MSLSNKHYSATCQSCGYNTEITGEIVSQEGFRCAACGSQISLWELPDKAMVKDLLTVRRDELSTIKKQKENEYRESSNKLKELQYRLDLLDKEKHPYDFYFLRASRIEDLQDRIRVLEDCVNSLAQGREMATRNYENVIYRLNNL